MPAPSRSRIVLSLLGCSLLAVPDLSAQERRVRELPDRWNYDMHELVRERVEEAMRNAERAMERAQFRAFDRMDIGEQVRDALRRAEVDRFRFDDHDFRFDEHRFQLDELDHLRFRFDSHDFEGLHMDALDAARMGEEIRARVEGQLLRSQDARSRSLDAVERSHEARERAMEAMRRAQERLRDRHWY